MCGIAGILNSNSPVFEDTVRRMLSSIAHRGPDGSGVWRDTSSGLALGHSRLSILDLSAAGHQPMQSACKRYVIAFNGEIYNWKDLRSKLESSGLAPTWRGHSDTEVLLSAIAAWGLEETLPLVRGMFAIALWDCREKTLSLARDRIGEKPLYYGSLGSNFVFASELKALRAIPDIQLTIDDGSKALMLRYGYVPSSRSIYCDIFKLPPGAILTVTARNHSVEPSPWWKFDDVLSLARASPLILADEQAINTLEETLASAISEQMIVDVPLGALLSGGIDSAAIVALMQARSSKPVRTFTVGFNEGDYDESSQARAVARHLGTDHTELFVTPRDVIDIIPRLPEIYDEPFADSSQIPTSLVCALTRKHVTVSLSGDAGDELFGGYNRYLWAGSMWHYLKLLPRGLRAKFASIMSAVPPRDWNRIFRTLDAFIPENYRVNNPGDKIHKLSEIFSASSQDALYLELSRQWRGKLPLINQSEPDTFLSNPNNWPAPDTFSERMMAVDTLTYLPDDILVKVDRAAMAASLEMRIPFLDERVINFAWRLPLHQKIRGGQGKWLLRQLLYRYVPQKLVDRPKQGFAVPIDHWLRGPLRDWAEDLLSPASLSADPSLDPAGIRSLWGRHLAGANAQHALWNILMYQAWRRRWA